MAVSLKDVKDALGYKTLSEFSADWKTLPDEDREQIKAGVENGTMTY